MFTMAAKFRFGDDVNRAALDRGRRSHRRADALVENAFASRVDMADRWNADPAVSGGGVLIDNGTALRRHRSGYFLGPIAEVLAVEGKPARRLRRRGHRAHVPAHRAGVLRPVDLSWSIDKSLADFLRIYGSRRHDPRRLARVGVARRTAREWVPFGDRLRQGPGHGAERSTPSAAAMRGDGAAGRHGRRRHRRRDLHRRRVRVACDAAAGSSWPSSRLT